MCNIQNMALILFVKYKNILSPSLILLTNISTSVTIFSYISSHQSHMFYNNIGLALYARKLLIAAASRVEDQNTVITDVRCNN